MSEHRRAVPGGNYVRSAEGSAVGRSEEGAKAALDLARSAASHSTLEDYKPECDKHAQIIDDLRQQLREWESGHWESERSQNIRHERDRLKTRVAELEAEIKRLRIVIASAYEASREDKP